MPFAFCQPGNPGRDPRAPAHATGRDLGAVAPGALARPPARRSKTRRPRNVRGVGDPHPMERLVRFPVKTILTVLGLIVAVWALLHVIVVARSVIVYILIALFLALAINPLVALLMRRGVRSRGLASGIACLIVLAAIAAIGFAFIPTLVDNVNNFVDAAPGYVHDLTKGKGRLGFLETKYHVVERLEKYVHHGGAKKLLGLSGAAVSVTKGVLSFIVGAVTVAFLTFFMLLEGPAWTERLFGLLSPESQPRWRAVGHDIYRQVGGYVTGNLPVSPIAGSPAAFVLLWPRGPLALAAGVPVWLLAPLTPGG